MSDPKQLTINWQDLEMAFESASDELGGFTAHTHYFDLQTGRVVLIDDDTRSALRSIEEELDDWLADGGELSSEQIENSEEYQQLPGWQQEMVLAAADLHFGDYDRYEEIPHFESHESYGYMEDFIKTVREPAIRDRLSEALHRRGPFHQFRAVLADDRRLERQWREYEIRRQHETMLRWLRSVGVEPTNPECREVNWEPLPDLRKIMFAEVRRFVRFARDLPGVERIALIGALTTDKEFPRGVEVVVTVSDDCDLTELAKLGRQLSGHMQSHRAGSIVFLADCPGDYLGQTCLWRECGPGFRLRCEALHCGARPYLHDNLNAFRLDKNLIAHPPVLLWPTPIVNGDVPDDVREQLIEPLAIDGQR